MCRGAGPSTPSSTTMSMPLNPAPEAAMRFLLFVTFAALAASAVSADNREEKKVSALDRKMTGIDGKEVDLSTYKGKVVLLVNVASQCGYTPQYEGLQK